MRTLFILLALVLPYGILAQNKQIPISQSPVTSTNITDEQILMSMAQNEYDQKRLGEALLLAQKAWNGSYYSEASYLIARIYEDQGEHSIALKHYQRALEEDKYKQSRIKYLYSLSNSYRLVDNFALYSQTLEQIEKEVLPKENYDIIKRQRVQAISILLEQGLNRVVSMYRWQHHSGLMATEALALTAYHIGNSKQDLVALDGFLYSVVAKSATILERLRYYDPSYTFTTVEKMLDDARVYAELRDYLDQSQFFRSYYFLATSISNYNGSSQSKVLFNRIRLRPEAKQWALQAQKQFENPFVDPFTFDKTDFRVS